METNQLKSLPGRLRRWHDSYDVLSVNFSEWSSFLHDIKDLNSTEWSELDVRVVLENGEYSFDILDGIVHVYSQFKFGQITLLATLDREHFMKLALDSLLLDDLEEDSSNEQVLKSIKNLQNYLEFLEKDLLIPAKKIEALRRHLSGFCKAFRILSADLEKSQDSDSCERV